MSPVANGGLFLLQFLVGLVTFVLILRFLMRATYVDWRHPVVGFIAKVTNPICRPLNALFKNIGRWDWSALLAAFIVEMAFVGLIGLLTGRDFGLITILMVSFSEIANQILDLVFWLIIIQVILSWVSPGYNPNTVIFDQMVSPILRPFQRIIPPIGGIDLSPLAVVVLIQLTQIVLLRPIVAIAQGFVGQ